MTRLPKTTVVLLLPFLFACENKPASQANTSADSSVVQTTSAETTPPIRFESVWVKLGDAKGAIDQESDIASVETAEFSPDGKYIISGSKKGWNVIMWEAATGNKKWEKQWTEEIEAVAFSRDGKYVAIGGEDKSIQIISAADGSPVKKLPLKASVDGLRFSNNGELLVGGDEIGLIHVWRTSDWKEIHTAVQGKDEGAEDGAEGAHADVNSIDFTKDDQYMSSGGRNSEVKLWKVADMHLIRTLKGHTGSVKSARISPDGKLVASASAWPDSTGDNSVRVWEFATGKQLAQFRHQAGMETVEFSPDGKFLLAGGREGGGYSNPNVTTGFIYVYRIPGDPLTEKIEPVHKESVFRSEYLHFSPDGKQLVTSHEDGTLRLWNVRESL